jgi:hypothetical protein
MPLKENLPKVKFIMDLATSDVTDIVLCSVCGADLSSVPRIGRNGYSVSMSMEMINVPKNWKYRRGA